MSKTKQIADAIIEQGMLPLYFNADETVSVDILRAVYRAGVKALEYTNRGDAALMNFKKMVAVRNAEMPGMLFGVGTVKNLQTAKDYLAAGADFLVSPGFVKEVADYAVANDIFYAPGCMTPESERNTSNPSFLASTAAPTPLSPPPSITSLLLIEIL